MSKDTEEPGEQPLGELAWCPQGQPHTHHPMGGNRQRVQRGKINPFDLVDFSIEYQKKQIKLVNLD